MWYTDQIPIIRVWEALYYYYNDSDDIHNILSVIQNSAYQASLPLLGNTSTPTYKLSVICYYTCKCAYITCNYAEATWWTGSYNTHFDHLLTDF